MIKNKFSKIKSVLLLSIISIGLVACANQNQPVKQASITQESPQSGAVLNQYGVLMVPSTSGTTSITCKVNQLCDIALEKGEIIHDINIGDSTRWQVTTTKSGGIDYKTQQAATPQQLAVEQQHVVIKPTYDNLSTSLLITTNKGRNYSILLNSTNDSSQSNLTKVEFYSKS